MATDPAFSKKINTTKLLLSSLFARKQDFLIVNGNQRNKFFYTNIQDDRVSFYKLDIDDTLSVVKITDLAAESLYEVFPQLKQIVGIIHLPTLMSTMNKKLASVKAPMEIIVDQATGVLSMDMPVSKDKAAEEMFEGQPVKPMERVEIGHLINEDIWLKYEEIVARFTSFVKDPIEREVIIPSAMADDKYVLNNVELTNNHDGTVVVVNLPLTDGESVVSFKEYLSKRKAQWKYRVFIQFNDRQNVAKVSYAYRDDLVDVLSIEPGTLWFPYRKILAI